MCYTEIRKLMVTSVSMNTKKILSIFLIAAILIVLVIPSVSASNDENSQETLPPVEIGCYRYFFLMPDDWYNE